MPRSEAPEIELVPLSLDHLPHVMTWVNDQRVMGYFANRQEPITEQEERRYLATLIASKNDRAFSIFSEGRYVGQCSVNQIYWPARNGRVFLVIRREEQHHGLGKAAMLALNEHAFDEMGLHKLWLIVRSDNRAAQAMYLKLGFDFEGVLRDEYFVKDRFFDMVRMSILAPE